MIFLCVCKELNKKKEKDIKPNKSKFLNIRKKKYLILLILVSFYFNLIKMWSKYTQSHLVWYIQTVWFDLRNINSSKQNKACFCS